MMKRKFINRSTSLVLAITILFSTVIVGNITNLTDDNNTVNAATTETESVGAVGNTSSANYNGSAFTGKSFSEIKGYYNEVQYVTPTSGSYIENEEDLSETLKAAKDNDPDEGSDNPSGNDILYYIRIGQNITLTHAHTIYSNTYLDIAEGVTITFGVSDDSTSAGKFVASGSSHIVINGQSATFKVQGKAGYKQNHSVISFSGVTNALIRNVKVVDAETDTEANTYIAINDSGSNKNISITGCTFTSGDSAYCSNAISCNNTQNLYINNITANISRGNSLYLSSVKYASVNNCTATATKNNGKDNNGNAITLVESSNNKIGTDSTITVKGYFNKGIYLKESNNNTIGKNISINRVSQGNAEEDSIGILLYGSSNNTIDGPVISGYYKNGIYLNEKSNENVVKNISVTNSTSSVGNCAVVVLNSNNNNLYANTVSGAFSNAIYLKESNENTIKRTVIKNTTSVTGDKAIFVVNSNKNNIGETNSNYQISITGKYNNAIYLSGSQSNNIYNVKVTGNENNTENNSGITLNSKSTKNTIKNVSVEGYYNRGIYLANGSDGNNLDNIDIKEQKASTITTDGTIETINYTYGVVANDVSGNTFNQIKVNGGNNCIGMRISTTSETTNISDNNNITNSSFVNCKSYGILVLERTKNTTIGSTTISNIESIKKDSNSYGIYVNPSYNPYNDKGVITTKTDKCVKIENCNSNVSCDDINGTNDIGDVSSKHICKADIGLGINALNCNSLEIPAKVEVVNTKFCHFSKYGIYTYNNEGNDNTGEKKIYISVELSGVEFESAGAVNTGGSGIIESIGSAVYDFTEKIDSYGNTTKLYKGNTTNMLYEISNDGTAIIYKAPTKDNSSADKDESDDVTDDDNTDSDLNTKNSDPFKIPNKVTYGGKEYAVTGIDDFAFSNYSGELGNGRVIIPSSIQKIGKNAFSNCSSLYDVYIGSGISSNSIGKNAFTGCQNLRNISVAKNMLKEDIKENTKTPVAERNKNYTSQNGVLFQTIVKSNNANEGDATLICMPSGYYNNNDFYVYMSSLKGTPVSTVKQLNECLENNTIYLYDEDTTECYFPEKTEYTTIGNGTHFTFKDIPLSATKLILYFNGVGYRVSGSRVRETTINNVTKVVYKTSASFSEDNGELVLAYSYNPAVDSTPIGYSYVIPDTVTYDTVVATGTEKYKRYSYTVKALEFRSFYNNKYITKLTINNSLEQLNYMTRSYNGNTFDYVSTDGPFINCSKLSSIVVDENNECFAIHDDIQFPLLYNKDKTILYYVPSGIDFGEEGIVNLAEETQTIANYALSYNSTLKEIKLKGENLYEIGIRAFYKSDNLEKIQWPTPIYTPNGSSVGFGNLSSFLDYGLKNVLNSKGYYVSQNYNNNTNLRIGFSKILLSDVIKVNGTNDTGSNLIKEAIQRMYDDVYQHIVSKNIDTTFENSDKVMSEDQYGYFNGYIEKFFKDSENNSSAPKNVNTNKTGVNNYESTDSEDTDKNKNNTLLSKKAKWTDEEKTTAEMQIDYSCGNNKNSYDYLFVVDKTGSMNEVSDASRSKMYDQYSTVYNAAKGILLNNTNTSDNSATNNRVGIISFSDTSYTDIMNTNTESKYVSSNYKEYWRTQNFGDDVNNYFTNDMNIIEKYLASTETEGTTCYDMGVDAMTKIADEHSKNRKMIVIFISDGMPSSGHEGEKEAETFRENHPDIPIFTILELADENAKKSQEAIAKISGYKAGNERYNKLGSDSNSLANAFTQIYDTVNADEKQIIQDTINGDMFKATSITVSKTIRTSDCIDIAVDIRKIDGSNKTFDTVLKSTEENLKNSVYLNVTEDVNGTNSVYSKTPAMVYKTKEKVRLIYKGVPNSSISNDTSKHLYYQVKYNNTPLCDPTKKGKISSGLMTVDYVNDIVGESVSFSGTLTAPIAANATEGEVNSETTILEKLTISDNKVIDNNGKTLSTKSATEDYYNIELNQGESSDEEKAKRSYFRLSKDLTTFSLDINKVDYNAIYTINVGLEIKDSTKVSGHCNTNKEDTDNNNYCFVVDNTDDTSSNNRKNGFFEITSVTKKINEVPSPVLSRSIARDIKVDLYKEDFDTNKYYFDTEKNICEDTIILMHPVVNGNETTEYDMRYTVKKGEPISVTFIDVPLTDKEGNTFDSIEISDENPATRYEYPNKIIITKEDIEKAKTNKNYFTEIKSYKIVEYLKKSEIEVHKWAYDGVENTEGLWFGINAGSSYGDMDYKVTLDGTGVGEFPIDKFTRTVIGTNDDTTITTTNKLPIYDYNGEKIAYTVTELGINQYGSFVIPDKYVPEQVSITNTLNDPNEVAYTTFKFSNNSKPEFSVTIDKVQEEYYGKTGTVSDMTSLNTVNSKYLVVNLTEGVEDPIKPISEYKYPIYENEISSFYVHFKNAVDDYKENVPCSIRINNIDNFVFTARLDFEPNETKTIKVVYDFNWNVDVQKAQAFINWSYRTQEKNPNDNKAERELNPQEYKDFSTEIIGCYYDESCNSPVTSLIEKENETSSNDIRNFITNINEKIYVKVKYSNNNLRTGYDNIPISFSTSEGVKLSENITFDKGETVERLIEVTSSSTADFVENLIARINYANRDEEVNPNNNEDIIKHTTENTGVNFNIFIHKEFYFDATDTRPARYELWMNTYANYTNSEKNKVRITASDGTVYESENLTGRNNYVSFKNVSLVDSTGKAITSIKVEQLNVPERYVTPSPQTYTSAQIKTAIDNKATALSSKTFKDYLKKNNVQVNKSSYDDKNNNLYFRVSSDSFKSSWDIKTNSEGIATVSNDAISVYDKVGASNTDGTLTGTTSSLPIYRVPTVEERNSGADTRIKYSIKELGVKQADGTYTIPKKYIPENETVTKKLNLSGEITPVMFDFYNAQRLYNLNVNIIKENLVNRIYYKDEEYTEEPNTVTISYQYNGETVTKTQTVTDSTVVSFKNLPLYDTNDEFISSIIVTQNNVPVRFEVPDSVTVNSTDLENLVNKNKTTLETTITDILKKGTVKIKKQSFDNEVEGICFGVDTDKLYNNCYGDMYYIAKINSQGESSNYSLYSKYKYYYETISSTGTPQRTEVSYLPIYDTEGNEIKYTVTELGYEIGYETFEIPKKYAPEKTSISHTIDATSKEYTFNFNNNSRNDYKVIISNVNNDSYGVTGENKDLDSVLKITDKGKYTYFYKPFPAYTKYEITKTNLNGKIYENEIGSFDVTFTNSVDDNKQTPVNCIVKVDGQVIFNENLTFTPKDSKTYRFLYDYNWNFDVRNVEATINYANKDNEVVTTDNIATSTLNPLEWKDFTVKILGLYEDEQCTKPLAKDESNNRYYYANKGTKIYVKTEFANKNQGRGYVPYLALYYGDEKRVGGSYPLPKGNKDSYGTVTFSTPITVDNSASVKDIVARVNWDERFEEVNPYDNEDSVKLEVIKVLDLSIEPIKSTADYYGGYDVVTSAMIYNKTKDEALLPSDNVYVKFTAYNGQPGHYAEKVYETKKYVHIPMCSEGEEFASNLVYFKWNVPSNLTNGDFIYWVMTINENKAVHEPSYNDNSTADIGRESLEFLENDGSKHIICNEDCLVPYRKKETRNTPYTKYEESVNEGYVEQNLGLPFDYITPSASGLNEYNNIAIWSEWLFDNENYEFVKETYGVTIGKFDTDYVNESVTNLTTGNKGISIALDKHYTPSKFSIIPDKNSPTVEKDEYGNYTMRAGYGFSLSYNSGVSSFRVYNNRYDINYDTLTNEEKSEKLRDSTTNIQMANAYYPEFMYMNEKFDVDGTTYYTYTSLDKINNENTDVFKNLFKLPKNKQSSSINSSNTEDSRIHFIPVWYKDGDYNISVSSTYLWTPCGMLSATDNSTNIKISGSVYDDWYVQQDNHE